MLKDGYIIDNHVEVIVKRGKKVVIKLYNYTELYY